MTIKYLFIDRNKEEEKKLSNRRTSVIINRSFLLAKRYLQYIHIHERQKI